MITEKIQNIDDKYNLTSMFFEESEIAAHKYMIVFLKIEKNHIKEKLFLCSDSKEYILNKLDYIYINGFIKN